MNVPAAFSIVSCAVGLLFALLTLGLSSSPGWRELRWYSVAAAAGGLYGATNLFVTLPVADHTIVVASRGSLFLTSVYGSMWFVYTAGRERRPLHRSELAIIAVGLALGVCTLVPGLALNDAVATHSVPWLGLVYRDAIPTFFGVGVYVYDCLAFTWLTTRYVAAALRGVPYTWPHALGLGALCAAGVHDSLASTGVIAMPYLVDLGNLLATCAVGGAIVSRFVEGARELERASVELRAAQHELVERERLTALGELAAVVAHEVRNPVGVMFNAIAGLRKHPEGEEGRALVGIVEEEAERLRRMVDGLLLFTRRSELQRDEVAVGALVQGVVRAATDAQATSECTLETELGPGVASVSCDEQLVRQALINLVTNAMQAAPRGKVRVVARAVDGEVRFEVEDDGHGVPEQLRERIFAPFFTTRPTGTGLGLSIVRRVAEAHGGSVALEGGSRFVLSIPRLQPPRQVD